MSDTKFICRVGTHAVQEMDRNFKIIKGEECGYDQAIKDAVGMKEYGYVHSCDVSQIRTPGMVLHVARKGNCPFSAAGKFAVVLKTEGGFPSQLLAYLDCYTSQCASVGIPGKGNMPFPQFYEHGSADLRIEVHLIPVIPPLAQSTAGDITDRLLQELTNSLKPKIMALAMSKVASPDTAVTTQNMQLVMNAIGTQLVQNNGATLATELKASFDSLSLE